MNGSDHCSWWFWVSIRSYTNLISKIIITNLWQANDLLSIINNNALKIKDVLIVTTKESNLYFKKIVRNGSKFGIKIKFKIQKEPKGIAHAIKIRRDLLKRKYLCNLGDNIFYFLSITYRNILSVQKNDHGASIFGYYMNDPNKYGVIKLNKK